MTLTGDVTLTPFSNPEPNAVYILEIDNDSAGLHTITWSGFFHPDGDPPTQTLNANATDTYTVRCNRDLELHVYPSQNFIQVD